MSDHTADGGGDRTRLTAVCRDGTSIGCANFTATEGGVLLTEDRDRDRVFGFVPNDRLRYVLPSETVDRIRREGSADGEFEDPLMRLPGVGSTYARRLRDAGYASVEDVAGADPEALADVTGATVRRTSEWVERAERRSETERASDESE